MYSGIIKDRPRIGFLYLLMCSAPVPFRSRSLRETNQTYSTVGRRRTGSINRLLLALRSQGWRRAELQLGQETLLPPPRRCSAFRTLNMSSGVTFSARPGAHAERKEHREQPRKSRRTARRVLRPRGEAAETGAVAMCLEFPFFPPRGRGGGKSSKPTSADLGRPPSALWPDKTDAALH